MDEIDKANISATTENKTNNRRLSGAMPHSDLKNEDDPKYEDEPKNEDNQKMKTT